MQPDAAEWIHQHVKNVVSIEVEQDWELSRVLRVRTTSGSVFFKSCTRLPLSADETRLMALLAQLYPADVPDLLAYDADQRWMLMGDVGATLRTLTDFALWRRALLRLAEIQRESMRQIDQFLDAGIRDGRSAHFDTLIDGLLADDAMFSGLEADEVDRLRALAPMLHEHNRALELVALVHGDVHGGNIGCKADQLRFFDWSESCIGHPFFDLPVMLFDALSYFPREQVDHLRDEYLACWEDGQRQWQIAAPVAGLQHAMMYNGVAALVAPHKPRVRVARWLRTVLYEDYAIRP